MNNKIEIYQGVKGEIVFNVDEKHETIWASQEQIAEAFGVDRTVIGRHLKNIYATGELDEKVTCAFFAHSTRHGAIEGKTHVSTKKVYNLDAIISVGYRVNSKKATDFRIWATKVLHHYVVDGAAINERRLKELDSKKLHEIEGALGIVKRLVAASDLSADEASGVLEVITKYSPSFKALKEYDEGHISFTKGKKTAKAITKDEGLKIVAELKRKIKGDELFGKPRGDAFESTLGAITQTFEDKDVYPSISEKAANLLYLIIKDHPFYDGNKRIGALLFVVFLTINDYHLTKDGETKISDRALTALALLIAESNPKEKGLLVALICKLLEN
ncbi:type II toxin-antitoxin system death-on-curing family toxin [Candidatus Saccharibacteria bacterium]|nr:type II toxin-antitoxin system death-on-curing family toxin [Candidatus Saccharibacteria bacterium]MBQ6313543.1 type II toxin-antitoxin system death-on-curing family toxin [Candidatus Saccharibacteria bacterium]